MLTLDLPLSASVSISIYNNFGQKVCELGEMQLPAGKTEMHWNALDQKGKKLSAGVYIIRAEAVTNSKKVLIVKTKAVKM